MDYTIKFTVTPRVCRVCDQWDPLRRRCKLSACRLVGAAYAEHMRRAAKADERRAAHG